MHVPVFGFLQPSCGPQYSWAVTIIVTTSVSRFFQIQLLSVSAGSSVSTTGVYPPPCLDLDPAPWGRLTNKSVLGKCRKESRIRRNVDSAFKHLAALRDMAERTESADRYLH